MSQLAKTSLPRTFDQVNVFQMRGLLHIIAAVSATRMLGHCASGVDLAS